MNYSRIHDHFGRPEGATLFALGTLVSFALIFGSLWPPRARSVRPPLDTIGRAIRYALNQWDALTLFLSDPALPPDNNESERRLRLIALGRKNYLFAGTDDGARNLAILMSLVVTCEANGIQPEAYLADVLIRMQTHPQSRIDELLPHNWSPLHDAEPTTDTACAAA